MAAFRKVNAAMLIVFFLAIIATIAEIHSLTLRLKATEAVAEDLSSTVEEQSSKIDEMKSDTDELKTKVDEQSSQIDELQSDVEALQTKLGE